MTATGQIFLSIVVPLLVAALWFAIAETYYYMRILTLAKIHSPGYLVPYFKLRRWKEFMDRSKKEYRLILSDPPEMHNPELLAAVQHYRRAWWICVMLCLVAILISWFFGTALAP